MALAPGGLRPLPGRHAGEPLEPRLAGPRPLRPLRWACLHPPVRRAAPDRVQPRPRGDQALSPVGVAHTRAPGALPHPGHRDHHRPARPGDLERGRHGDGGEVPRPALQPPGPHRRRPPRLRHRLRRGPDGGRLPGGRLARGRLRAREAHLLLRRQPHHDRRHDRALLRLRGQGQALRGLRLARPARGRRQRPRRPPARRHERAEGRRAPVAHRRPQPHRLSRPQRPGHRQGARCAARRGRGPRDEGDHGLGSRRALRRARRASTST